MAIYHRALLSWRKNSAQTTVNMWIDTLLGLLPGDKYFQQTFKRNEYVGALAQLCVTIMDLKLASEAFLGSIEGKETFMPFDAHVSDCGCHLRAQLLMEKVFHYKKHPEKLEVFRKVIEVCEGSLLRASELSKALCWLEQSPLEFGLPKQTATRDDFKIAIEWVSDKFDGNLDIKYVYYCYTLSRFKRYNERNLKDSVEFDLDAASKCLNSLVYGFTCQGKGKLGEGCRYLKHAKIGKGFVKTQTTALQARLSQMSVEYLVSLVPELSNELKTYCVKSKKGIYAVPALLQYKVLERVWSARRTPLFLAIRFFDGDLSKFYYTFAMVAKGLQWAFHNESKRNEPHIAITFDCEISGLACLKDDDLSNVMCNLQPKMRETWYTFMTQHKQYPFELCGSLEQDLEAKIHSEVEVPKFRNTFHEPNGANLEPKHIFLDYPRAVTEKQASISGKAGTLLIN